MDAEAAAADLEGEAAAVAEADLEAVAVVVAAAEDGGRTSRHPHPTSSHHYIVLSLLYHCYGTKSILHRLNFFHHHPIFQETATFVNAFHIVKCSPFSHNLHYTIRLCAIILTYKNHLFSNRISFSPEKSISVNCYILK